MTSRPRSLLRCLQAVATAVAVAAGVTTDAACSAILARPPDHPIRELDECSSSVFPPIVDVVLAGTVGGAGAFALLEGVSAQRNAESEIAPSWDAHRRESDRAPAQIVTGLALTAAAVAATASASYGFGSVKRCRVARRELRWQQPPRFYPGAPLAPPGYPPPPVWPPQGPGPLPLAPPPEAPAAPPPSQGSQ
ncbi:MAG TPA: hypothetical protein VIU64_00410 [Polyangia bacterium]